MMEASEIGGSVRRTQDHLVEIANLTTNGEEAQLFHKMAYAFAMFANKIEETDANRPKESDPVDDDAVPMISAKRTLTENAIQSIVRAIEIAGPAPEIHGRQLRRLRKEWPTLYRALSDLLIARGWSLPPEWA